MINPIHSSVRKELGDIVPTNVSNKSSYRLLITRMKLKRTKESYLFSLCYALKLWSLWPLSYMDHFRVYC